MWGSTCAWIQKIMSESFIVNYYAFSTAVSVYLYFSIMYTILTLLHWLKHSCEGYFADMAQPNTYKGRYADEIAVLTSNLAAASQYNRILFKYICLSGVYTAYGDLHFSLINNKRSMSFCNTATTHQVWYILNAAPILYHVVTSNARALIHNYYVQSREIPEHMISFGFPLLYVPSTRGNIISWVYFRCA